MNIATQKTVTLMSYNVIEHVKRRAIKDLSPNWRGDAIRITSTAAKNNAIMPNLLLRTLLTGVTLRGDASHR